MALFSFPSTVNERAARLVATGVVTLSVAAFVLNLPWLVPLLAVGFFLRVGWGPKVSPLARLAVFAAGKLWEAKPVSGAPKRFAQGIGLVFTLTVTALLFSGATTAGWALLGGLVFAASLEAFAGFCLGCWIYGRLQLLGVFPPDVCVDCAPAGLRTN